MGAPPPLVRELSAAPDVLRRLAAEWPERYPVLLDSAVGGPLGAFSVLAACPDAALWLDRTGRLGGEQHTPEGRSFLEALEAWFVRERAALERGPWPFAGGWVVFLGYEIAAEIEPRLSLPEPPGPWRAFALRTRAALVHERARDRLCALAEPGCEALLERLAADVQQLARSAPAAAGAIDVRSIEEEPPRRFLARVARAKEHIAAGDIYQANLSRGWRVRLAPLERKDTAGGAEATRLAALYERLRSSNPAPFAALARWGGMAILSSSPERLVRIAGREISTRPIAGTRPRSRRAGEDAPEAAALVAHPKERAEHVMLIDLERNDLGRVCEAGSVRVEELMAVETYAHVHHLVSSVRGRLRPEVSPVAALRAVFPGGTITGCPKVRCMQLIAELEGEGRGAYTGSLGYIGIDGSADFNILIRTLTASGGVLELRAGAGIVADSEPGRELEETRAKARGLLAALGPPAGGTRP